MVLDSGTRQPTRRIASTHMTRQLSRRCDVLRSQAHRMAGAARGPQNIISRSVKGEPGLLGTRVERGLKAVVDLNARAELSKLLLRITFQGESA